MKSATAHKMVLNMISTAAMSRLGFVHGNLMVNVVPKNEKLKQRALTILQRASGKDPDKVRLALEAAGGRTPVALVMLVAGISKAQAVVALRKSFGHVRSAITIAKPRQSSKC
jgi:N-acetylmuramic acid 6-phosphate etherase